MITALFNLGRNDEARQHATELLRLEPTFTVARYLELSPGAPYKLGQDVAAALTNAGIPEKS
jgi:hypothetical protein